MSDISISQILDTMRVLKAKAQGFEDKKSENANVMFSDSLKQAISSINDTQMQASSLQEAFEKGKAGVSLPDVMIATQKANIGFQAVVQVRNRLIQAYKDIRDMPI